MLLLEHVERLPQEALWAVADAITAQEAVTVHRDRTHRTPARAVLVATTNPCPCGKPAQTTGLPSCTCSAAEVAAHQERQRTALFPTST